ncbi:MAG TPA: short-chain dehydrogenase [Gammaproteobacteria bacterium]|jgi:NAD(P)-dependent dehydrogenase (short-subunit alcohol dehydrogenase family)|nr:short-chain dehydrogenase [Gammaproteobacteria bacterium]
MENKSILISGCSSGIGLATAEVLKKRGYRVFATARKTADVERLKEKGFESFQLDMADSDSIIHCVEQVLAATNGSLYALFNNAGFGIPAAVEDLSREALRVQFETNVFGLIELTNLIIPVMRKQGEGRIIQNSSVLGLAPFPFRGAYNASKFAIEGISDTLRMELLGSGIVVSLIEPGPIISQFRQNGYRAYLKYIDGKNSYYKNNYAAMEERLLKEGPVAPFTLPPEAVAEKVIHALESPRPKIRYYVTKVTYIFAFLRRVLPFWLLDKVLLKASGSGSR